MGSEVAAWVLTCGLTVVLLWAGLEKLRSFTAFEQTLTALGIRTGLRKIMLVVVPLGELTAAVGMVMLPGQHWPRLLIVLLAMGFALAGVLGMRTGQRIECSCFGTAGNAVLGMRQLYALPFWLAAVGALEFLTPAWSRGEGLLTLAVITLGLAALRAPGLVGARRAAAADRYAVAEALHPHHSPMFVAGREGS